MRQFIPRTKEHWMMLRDMVVMLALIGFIFYCAGL